MDFQNFCDLYEQKFCDFVDFMYFCKNNKTVIWTNKYYGIENN